MADSLVLVKWSFGCRFRWRRTVNSIEDGHLVRSKAATGFDEAGQSDGPYADGW